jgi:hypothetical protein
MTPSKTQREYDKKRQHAERQVDKAVSKIKRATTSIDLWQRRARYYAAEAQVTDAEREARRLANREKKLSKDKTRRITVAD